MNRRELLLVGTRLRKQFEGAYKAPLTPAMLALLAQLRAADKQAPQDLANRLSSDDAVWVRKSRENV